MIISVKRKHIKNGIIGSVNCCPVALAIAEVFLYKKITVGCKSIMIGYKYIKSSRSVQRFINKFDQKKKVKPFNFILRNVDKK